MPDPRLAERLAQQFPERAATPSEQGFFQQQPTVAGYAAPDGAVVLNPFLLRTPEEQEAVRYNERLRQGMAGLPTIEPFFPVEHQTHALRGTPYETGGRPADETGYARLLSGDPSLAPYTMRQREMAARIVDALMKQQR